MSNTFGKDAAAVLLGIVLIIIVAGVILLALNETEVPDVLQIIGGVTGGALANLATGNKTAP
jgi:hypothetical protein